MAKDKTCNLQCTKCNAQSECTSLVDSLSEMRCGLNGGHVDNSCKVNLQIDGKPVFELNQIQSFGKSSKKDDSKKDESKNDEQSDAKKE